VPVQRLGFRNIPEWAAGGTELLFVLVGHAATPTGMPRTGRIGGVANIGAKSIRGLSVAVTRWTQRDADGNTAPTDLVLKSRHPA